MLAKKLTYNLRQPILGGDKCEKIHLWNLFRALGISEVIDKIHIDF